jgi:hypothetical protein
VKTLKNQLGVIVGIALVLGLARVGARAEDTNDVTAPKPVKVDRPERPPRPEKPGKGVDATELKDIIKNFQDQKKEFLRQQKEQQREDRGKVREEVTSGGTAVGPVRHELKDSISEMRAISREQARRLLEEQKAAAKEAAKGGHNRD